jgi:hypothetical protein
MVIPPIQWYHENDSHRKENEMFNVSELIDQVRDSVREYDGTTMSDESIVRRLNRAYSYAYNYLVKMNHSLFSGFKYVTLKPNISEYKLPRDCYTKRVHELYFSTDGGDWQYVKRCEPSAITKYAGKSMAGVVYWTQAGEKIILAPTPKNSSVLKCLITLPLIPLAKVQGQITGIKGDKIYLDRSPDEDAETNLNRTGLNLISISDEMTGKVKALYPYNEVDGESFTLSDAFNRTDIRERQIYKALRFAPQGTIYYDLATKVISCNLSTNLTSLIKVGDSLELQRIISGKYNITESLETDEDFYNPPEYELPDNTFSSVVKVLEITPVRVTFIDESAVPDFVDGYPYPYDATYGGNIVALGATTISGNQVILLETGGVHGILPGKVVKLNIIGTGTSLDGTRKCIAVSVNQIAVYVASYTGVFTPGTWNVFKYSNLVITTGWPKIYDVSPGTPLIEMIQLYQGTPNTYLAIPEKTEDMPDPSMVVGDGILSAYDHDNDVKVGDWVTLGYSTGIPVHSDLVEEMLIFYASLTMKSSINETDNEMLAILKEKVAEIGNDTDGRNLQIEMQRPYTSKVANQNRGVR